MLGQYAELARGMVASESRASQRDAVLRELIWIVLCRSLERGGAPI
jgi:hypothetical protein